MKIGIIIPAYNAGDRLQNVLLKSQSYIPKDRIYVVDDGSSDTTSSIARSADVVLIRHKLNMGKGEALKSGFYKAIQDGLDAVFTIDADGQHDPDLIPHFIDHYQRTNADLILGTRQYKLGKMPADRILSNRLSSMIVSAAARRWIPDSQCGYRLIKTDLLQKITLHTSFYEMESELIIKACRAGLTVAHCPVTVRYDGAGSHIHRLRDTIRFCRLILSLNRK